MIILGAIIVVFLSVFAVGAVIINMEDKSRKNAETKSNLEN